LNNKLEAQLARLSDPHDLTVELLSDQKKAENSITGYPLLNMRVMSMDNSEIPLITMCSEYANQLITYDAARGEVIEERELKERP